jgi:anti-sigma B factor antagonist
MPQEPLRIDDSAVSGKGRRVLSLTGPLIMNNLFDFQAKVRTNVSQALVIDLTNVPYVDSAGIGALVGAYVTHQKDGKSLSLVGVNDRVMNALKVTRVEQFFRFFRTVQEAEQQPKV